MSSPARGMAATAIGAVAAAALIAAQAVLLVPGLVIGLAALLAICALPLSPELPRRIGYAAAIGLGWAPLLWWWPWRLGNLTRIGLVGALAVGGLLAWLLAATGPRRAQRLRAVVPRWRRADLAFATGVLLVLAYVWPLLRSRTPAEVMEFVTGGWDNVGHFDMARMILHHGVTIDRLAPGPDGPWYYASYPQGFHATVAAYMELEVGVGGAAAGFGEIAAYLRGAVLVYAATITLVLAVVCAIPSLRRRPLATVVLVGGLLIVWLVSPGGAMMLAAGFVNFVLGVALTAVTPLLAWDVRSMRRPAALWALSGALVGIAHTWILLLPIGAASCLPLGRAVWLSRRRLTRGWWSMLGVAAAATILAVGAAARQVFSNQGVGQLLVEGGFPLHSLASYLVPALLGLALAGYLGWWRRSARPIRWRRWGGGGIGLGVGALLVAAVALAEWRASGQITYYGLKALCGVMLLALTYVVGAAGDLGHVRAARGRAAGRLVSIVAVLALVACSGVSIVRQGSDFPSIWVRTLWTSAPRSFAEQQTPLLGRMLAVEGLGSREALVLADRSVAPVDLAQANLWQLAARGAWSQAAQRCFDRTWQGSLPIRQDRLVEWVPSVLGCDDRLVVLVPAAVADEVRRRVPELADRVLAW